MVGEVLAGRFKLVSLLGQGGYGAVFEATQLSMRRRCAVKVLHERLLGDEMASERFRSEAIATSKLQQGNSVIIYDFGEDEERDLLFIAMEYLEGTSLNDMIKEQGKLPLDVVLHIVDQMASSLQDAHDNGIVHRDIKPHNAMVMQRGRDPHFVKVIDFGIAKLLQEATLTPLENVTQTGVMIGTPHYMAPEQIRGQLVDGRTDQYALANCIYKMLLGHTPLQGNTPVDVAVQQLTEIPKPLRSFDDTLPVNDSFEQVLERALSKEIEDRYPRITDFANALRASLRGQATVPIDISGVKMPPRDGALEDTQDAGVVIESTLDAPVVASTGPMAFDPMTGEPLAKKMSGDAFAPTSEQRTPPSAGRGVRDSGPTPLGKGVDLSGSLAGVGDEPSENNTVAATTPDPRQSPAFRTDLTLQAVTPSSAGSTSRATEETPSGRTASIPEPKEQISSRADDDTFEQPSPRESEKSRLPLLLVGLFLSVALLVAVFAIVMNARQGKGGEQNTDAALVAKETTSNTTEAIPEETSPPSTTPETPEKITITITISGVGKLFVDSVEVEVPPGGAVALAPGPHVLEVRHDDKVISTQKVTVSGDGPKTFELEGHVVKSPKIVEEKPDPPVKQKPATVTVKVSGDGEITLDGKEDVVKEGKALELDAGDYTFAVVHDGKEIDSKKTTLEAGKAKLVKLKGYKKPAQPVLVQVPVSIIPAGTLLVDGAEVPINAQTRSAPMRVGRRTVKAVYTNGTSSRPRTVTITDGQNARIVFNRNNQ